VTIGRLQPKHAGCIQRFFAAHSRESCGVHEPRVRSPSISHDYDLHSRAGHYLQRDSSAAAEHLVVRMRREHHCRRPEIEHSGPITRPPAPDGPQSGSD
jgi:hypothetical protein